MALRRSADVCVVGGGIIGRCIALALAERGVRVDIVSREQPGASSRAAAGLLAPSIEGGTGAAHDFAVAARDAYPEFLKRLASYAAGSIEFSRAGILDVALDDASEQRLRAFAATSGVPWLAPNEIRALEPALAPTRGGVIAELDGYIDNVALMDTLERATAALRPHIREVTGLVSRLQLAQDSATLILEPGERLGCGAAVLAAGAWSGTIGGLPRPLPVRPLKGEMIRYDAPAGTGAMSGLALQRPVYGAGVYVVPRRRSILVGATGEDVGFDVALTGAAASTLAGGAKQLLTQLEGLDTNDHWSGLRPMTADALPILGRDPDFPALIYASGHSRNGILKAPLTGDCVAALFLREPMAYDLTPFSPVRHEVASMAPAPAHNC
jgi:glycine oxidase